LGALGVGVSVVWKSPVGVGHAAVALAAGGVALVPVDPVNRGAVGQPDAELLVAAQREAGPAVAVQLDLQVPSAKGEKLSGAYAPVGIDHTPPPMGSSPITSAAPGTSRSSSTSSVIPESEPSSSTLTTAMEAGSRAALVVVGASAASPGAADGGPPASSVRRNRPR